MTRLLSDQPGRGNGFSRSCVRLRKRLGLTQRALGEIIDISEQTIQHWERGMHLPTREHLERLLTLGLQHHAFAPSREHEEAHQMWLAGRQQADFDAFWMRTQLAAPSPPSALVVLKQKAAQGSEPLSG